MSSQREPELDHVGYCLFFSADWAIRKPGWSNLGSHYRPHGTEQGADCKLLAGHFNKFCKTPKYTHPLQIISSKYSTGKCIKNAVSISAWQVLVKRKLHCISFVQ